MYTTIFGKEELQPEYVAQLGIKWCTDFELLWMKFNKELARMDTNYKKGMRAMREVLNSRKFWYLTIFGKLTILKTLCIPKFTHIAMVIPNLCVNKINEIEGCWENFIKTNSSLSVDQNTRYNTKQNLGLKMLNIADFWQLVRLSLLHRLPYSKATWVNYIYRM